MRNIMKGSLAIALGLALVCMNARETAGAAEFKLSCAVALHPAMDELVPQFERTSGRTVTVAYGNAGAIADRFQKGEAADLLINSAPLMDKLQSQGKILASDRNIIAKVGVGAFVSKGAPKPDISSTDAIIARDSGRNVNYLS